MDGLDLGRDDVVEYIYCDERWVFFGDGMNNLLLHIFIVRHKWHGEVAWFHLL